MNSPFAPCTPSFLGYGESLTAPLRVIREMPHTASRPSRALVTTATIGTVVALLAATIAVAAASGTPDRRPARADSAAIDPVSGSLNLAWLQQLAPPPGAALLLIAGILVARRGHR